MIPRDNVTAWRATAPWVEDSQVEQDLVISRALVEMFSHPILARWPGRLTRPSPSGIFSG